MAGQGEEIEDEVFLGLCQGTVVDTHVIEHEEARNQPEVVPVVPEKIHGCRGDALFDDWANGKG